jgi:N-acetylglucosamine-6-phosphate deacetylase
MAYFDLQVNGFAGVDFNGDALDPEALEKISQQLELQGVGGILATIITDSIPAMEMRLQRLADLLHKQPSLQRVIRGIHIEGPFLNANDGYRGAHPQDAITPADAETMQRLLTAAGGFTRIVTLAPECDLHFKVTRMLADMNIMVSAGHTDASLRELYAAIDAGLGMFTHLGNGCPASLPRHDNIVQRALSLRDHLWLCFICDGAHIPFFALNNYLATAGIERSIVVTDAIAAADLGPGDYRFGRWELKIGDDLVARSPDNSHLVGSTITMPKSYLNITERLGLSVEQALTLLDRNPHRALQLPRLPQSPRTTVADK